MTMQPKCLAAERGFTIIELVVSITLMSIVFAGLFGVVIATQRNYFRQRDASSAEDAVRTAELVIGMVLRNAGADPMSAGLGVLDPDPLNHAVFDNLRVASDINADGDRLDDLEDVLVWTANDTLYVRWKAGGAGVPLLHPVRPLRFHYYANDGYQYTDKVEASAGATRIKVLFRAPSNVRSTTLQQRELWVYLRNRR